MGFSPLGLGISLAVFLPTLLLVPFPPREGWPAPSIPLVFTILERAGQALCVILPVVVEPGPFRWGWTIPLVGSLAAYYALWARYLFTGRNHAALYRPVWRVPVPMALLPVAGFLSAAALLSNVWLGIAAVILASGHVPASLLIARGTTRTPPESRYPRQ